MIEKITLLTEVYLVLLTALCCDESVESWVGSGDSARQYCDTVQLTYTTLPEELSDHFHRGAVVERGWCSWVNSFEFQVGHSCRYNSESVIPTFM